jgi:hypothetical protein
MRIIGDKALSRYLQTLPRAVRNKILRPAMTSAARPVRQAAKANARGSFAAGSRQLEKTIDIKVKSTRRGAYAVIGPRSDKTGERVNLFGVTVRHIPSKISHLVEAGAAPHVIMLGRGRKTAWQHPGTPATKFMERAWNSTSSQSMRIIEAKIQEGIARHA